MSKSLFIPNRDAIAMLKEYMHEPVFEADLYCAETCYGKGDLVFQDVNDYVFNTAIRALEKEEKYKWHDLRKNKNDLPEISSEINYKECQLENGLILSCVYQQDHYGHKMWRTIANGTNLRKVTKRVIRWREIEELEEV